MALKTLIYSTIAALFVIGVGTIGPEPVLAYHPHEHPDDPKVPDRKAHRPTAIPDRIVLTWKGDPATTQAVTWRTDTTVTEAVAQITVSDDGPFFETRTETFPAQTTDLKTDLGNAHYHSVNFENLTPDTLYVYRVGDGTNWSAWIHFRTASMDNEPFSFIYFGDAQNSLKSHWSRVFRQAFRDAPKTRFMLYAGDLINVGDHDAEWGEWCGAAGWVNGMIPTIAVPGNHEYGTDDNGPWLGEDRLSDHWRVMFEYPEHGPEKLEETVYWIDYQGVRIVALNSNEMLEEQAEWLDKVLAENPQRWTIVTQHHPVYCTKENRRNPRIERLWQPLFDKYRVDLVLQGHDHSYGRTELRAYDPSVSDRRRSGRRGGRTRGRRRTRTRRARNVPEGVNVRSPEAGTVYVVSVSGPKMYAGGSQPFVRRAEDTQLYQVISIDGDRLRYEARTARGILYDAFTLKKREGQVNELIEQVPDLPERRRVPAETEEAAN